MLAWWLASRFNRVYERIAVVKEVLSDKIDAHEKLDFERFEAQKLATMRLEMWAQGQGKPLHGI